MVDVRFELTTNDPWSVDDAICEGISPLGYWQKVNQSPTQPKPYNTGSTRHLQHFPFLRGWRGGHARFWYRIGTDDPTRTTINDGFDVGFPCLSACVLLQFDFLRLAPPPR